MPRKCKIIVWLPTNGNSFNGSSISLGHAALKIYPSGTYPNGMYLSFFGGNAACSCGTANRAYSHFHAKNHDKTIYSGRKPSKINLSHESIDVDAMLSKIEELFKMKPEWGPQCNCADLVLIALRAGIKISSYSLALYQSNYGLLTKLMFASFPLSYATPLNIYFVITELNNIDTQIRNYKKSSAAIQRCVRLISKLSSIDWFVATYRSFFSFANTTEALMKEIESQIRQNNIKLPVAECDRSCFISTIAEITKIMKEIGWPTYKKITNPNMLLVLAATASTGLISAFHFAYLNWKLKLSKRELARRMFIDVSKVIGISLLLWYTSQLKPTMQYIGTLKRFVNLITVTPSSISAALYCGILGSDKITFSLKSKMNHSMRLVVFSIPFIYRQLHFLYHDIPFSTGAIAAKIAWDIMLSTCFTAIIEISQRSRLLPYGIMLSSFFLPILTSYFSKTYYDKSITPNALLAISKELEKKESDNNTLVSAQRNTFFGRLYDNLPSRKTCFTIVGCVGCLFFANKLENTIQRAITPRLVGLYSRLLK